MIEQGSIEWKLQRLGHVTASRVADVMAKGRNGEAKSREDYRFQLACERLSGTFQEGYTSQAMEWGTNTEPEARMAYEVECKSFVDQVSFIKHPEMEFVGCSPDGLVGEQGGLEIKCPNSETHLRTIYEQKIPSKYYPQVQMSMWVTGRHWWDFVSYDPRLPPELRFFVVRILRDEEYIQEMEAEVKQFLLDVEKTIELVKERRNAK